MSNYKRLNFTDREELSRYLILNYSYRKIGTLLGRSPSTICREVNRHSLTKKSYRAISAQQTARQLAHKPRRQRLLDQNPELLPLSGI